MPTKRVQVTAPMGTNKSVAPSMLPPEVWTDTLDVRFQDGYAMAPMGYKSFFATVPTGVSFMISNLSGTALSWYEANDTKIYNLLTTVFDPGDPAANHEDVSRVTGGAYSSSLDTGWSGCVLNGVVLMNNENDIPQVKRPADAKFLNLPNWPSAYRCKNIVAFKNYLLALNIYNGSVWVPNMVKWSSPADPGEVPYTWDETDPTNDAGEVTLGGQSEEVVAAKELGENLYIYKLGSVHMFQYIGGTYIFNNRLVFNDQGALTRDCVADFNGQHFVVGLSDVYIHNGVEKKSVIDGVMRDALFRSMRQDAKHRTFLVRDNVLSEMWVCFCSTDNMAENMACDKAFVYNWVEGTWAIVNIPLARYGTYGVMSLESPTDTWDPDSEEWNGDMSAWGQQNFSSYDLRMIMTSPARGRIYLYNNQSSAYDTEECTSRLQKDYINLDDDRNMKQVISLTPHVDGDGELSVYIGTAKTDHGPILWSGPFNYVMGGEQYKIDFRAVGRYLSVRFDIPGNQNWRINGYTAEFADLGGMR